MAKDLLTLPSGLPAPVDDGACSHLLGISLPGITLQSTDGSSVALNQLRGTIALYMYPMTGKPDASPMIGWNEIPGARGCTPQSCAFRDHYRELQSLGAIVYGLSVQSTADQEEARQRLHLPFHLLSDQWLAFQKALTLPTFIYEGRILIKRITLIVRNGVVCKVFYPVFPPDSNAEAVIDWLRLNPDPADHV